MVKYTLNQEAVLIKVEGSFVSSDPSCEIEYSFLLNDTSVASKQNLLIQMVEPNVVRIYSNETNQTVDSDLVITYRASIGS